MGQHAISHSVADYYGASPAISSTAPVVPDRRVIQSFAHRFDELGVSSASNTLRHVATIGADVSRSRPGYMPGAPPHRLDQLGVTSSNIYRSHGLQSPTALTYAPRI